MIKSFEASRLKLSRARKHYQELSDDIAAYAALKGIVVRNEASTVALGPYAWAVRMNEPAPTHWSAIIGDVIHNLRSALDLLACDLVRLEGRSVKQVHFPFCNRPEDLPEMIRRRKLHRAHPEAVAMIMRLQPYNGGNVELRAIHDLNIKDKHSALILVAASGTPPSARVPTNAMGSGDGPSRQPDLDGDGPPLPIQRPRPRRPRGSGIPARFHFLFDFDGAALQGYEVLETLGNCVDVVQSVLDAFRDWSPTVYASTSDQALRNPRSA